MAGTGGDPFELCFTEIDGKYQVLELVGEGGFGVVYKGVHLGFDTPVAIKCLKLPVHLNRAAQEDLIQRLREEGRLLMQLSKKTTAIVQAHDVGAITRDGVRVPYLILEWLEGHTLADEMDARRAEGRGAATPQEALELLAPAFEAVAIAHEERIAHRDLKPENLFLVAGAEGAQVKVLDFGIAKLLGDAPSVDDTSTSHQPRVFTPSYGAPEQFDRRVGATGPWTDVFALALVFVELVSGRRALPGEGFMEIGQRVLDPDQRPTLSALGVDASDAIEAVLRRALEVEPRARYADARDFLTALRKAVEASPHVERAKAPPPATGPVLDTAAFMSASGLDDVGLDDVGLESTVTAPVSSDEEEEHKEEEQEEEEEELDGEVAVGARIEPASRRATTTSPTTTRAAVTAPATVAAVAKPISRTGLLVVVTLAAAALVFAWRSQNVSSPTPSPSASPSASAAPVSSNAEAAALYREALVAWRGGSPDDAVKTMTKALRVDRALAAGHLRMAIWKIRRRPVQARTHYQLAQRHLSNLTAEDAALFEAVEPLVRSPWDLAETDRRLGQLAEARKVDVEVWAYLASTRVTRRHFERALEAVKPLLAADDEAVAGWVLRGASFAGLGDQDQQVAAYEACLTHVPGAVECQRQLVGLYSARGDCAAMRDGARRLVTLDPQSPIPHINLAEALFATGASLSAVKDVLSRRWSFTSQRDQTRVQLGDEAALAILRGDFHAAAAAYAEWSTHVAEETEQQAHADPAMAHGAVHLEAGLRAEADRLAKSFLERMGGWTEPAHGDLSIFMLAQRLRAGGIDAAKLAEARDPWTERMRANWAASGRKQGAAMEWALWSGTYGVVATNEARAVEAVKHMPAEETGTMKSGRHPGLDLQSGRALVLAGQHQRALPPLRRLTRSCSALLHPLTWLQAHYFLGLALEAAGDTIGAKKAYGVVLAHWGQAKPASTTAELAKKRIEALE